MKKLLSIIFSITMLLSMATEVFADGVAGPMQKAKIKVAISADFPPFEYYNENEELYGFDVDLMNYIGERIGFAIEFVNMEFDYEYTAMPVPTNLPDGENDTTADNAMSDGTPLAPPSDWALSDVKKAEALNITEKGKIYRYSMSITREEFCELIYNK